MKSLSSRLFNARDKCFLRKFGIFELSHHQQLNKHNFSENMLDMLIDG